MRFRTYNNLKSENIFLDTEINFNKQKKDENIIMKQDKGKI